AGIDHVRRDHHHEGVAVGRRLQHRVGPGDAVRARSVLDEDVLSPGFGELLRELPADDVGAAARRVGNDDSNGLRRELRVRGGREQNTGDEEQGAEAHRAIIACNDYSPLRRQVQGDPDQAAGEVASSATTRRTSTGRNGFSITGRPLAAAKSRSAEVSVSPVTKITRSARSGQRSSICWYSARPSRSGMRISVRITS